jgi:hypothetical protein
MEYERIKVIQLSFFIKSQLFNTIYMQEYSVKTENILQMHAQRSDTWQRCTYVISHGF